MTASPVRWIPLLLLLLSIGATAQVLRKPVPDKLVVLTFDDAASTHATYVAPLLKKYGFGGTFFVCEFPPDFEDKAKYMTWAQIRALAGMGFEVANHTGHHIHVDKLTGPQLHEELAFIEKKCEEFKIRKPVSFAYPAYVTSEQSLAVLGEKGYTWARVGGSRAYDPTTDHPYVIPSFSTTGTDKQRVLDAIGQAKDGKIVVLTVHGVPDYAHDWVTTPPALFEEYLRYLHDNGYQVIALRDLSRYIHPKRAHSRIQPVLPAPK